MTEQKPYVHVCTAHDYEMALASQSACNLSGIVHSLSRVFERIWQEVRENGGGTEQANTHPICRLYAEQIGHLTKASFAGSYESWYEAHRICTERAAELKKTAEPEEATA